MFDFEKALKASKEMSSNTNLFLIALGPSGGGKSYLMGTLEQKTLYLYVSGESHGPQSARVPGGDLVEPYCLDFYDGKQLDPDATFKNLLFILNSGAMLKKHGYKAVAIDGASELEFVIRNTKEWNIRTTNDKGKHDGFMEINATCDMFRQVTSAAKNLQREIGVHIFMTCVLDVRSVGEYGEILESAPRLRGARVAETLVQQFDEVVAIGRMVKDDVVKHKIQMMTKMSKIAKEVSGASRAVNYNPRITGLSSHEIPAFLPASLKSVVDLKKGEYEAE